MLSRSQNTRFRLSNHGKLIRMDLDFSEEAFQPRDPWRFHLPLPAETKVAASAGFSSEYRVPAADALCRVLTDS